MTSDAPQPGAPQPGAQKSAAKAAGSSKYGNLLARIGAAVVAVPILLLAMYQDRPEWIWGIVFAGSMLAMHEFFAMTLADSVDRTASMLFGAVTVAAFYWVPLERGGTLLPLFCAVVPPALYYVFRFGDINTAAGRMAATSTGILYAGVLLTSLALIKRDAGSGHFVMLVLMVPWISDTGAYFGGRVFGKRKLYPALSPGKTWAGGVGGVVGALAAAAGIKLWAMPEFLSWVDVAVLAVPGGILCQLGDLFESLLKRSSGVKDSGSLIPGHGGVLDRIDAVLFYGPFVYLYFVLKA